MHEDSALAYTLLTMKPPPSYATTSALRKWNTNSYHHTSTDGMPPNAPFILSRTISLPVSQAQTPTSPFRTGAASYPKPNSPLISSAPLASIPNFRPMPNSRVPLISHAHPSHPQVPESSSTKYPPTDKLGPRMARMAGTLAQPSTIINAIASGYHARTTSASSTPSVSSPKPFHFPNLPTKTPRSKRPVNFPTPYNNHVFRGQLTQFHDDLLTSLRELSKIFHTLALGVENIAPGVDAAINKHLPPVSPPTPAPPPDTPTTPTSPQPLTKLPYDLRPRMSRPHYPPPPPPPSHTAKPASLWNTETSSTTPPHVPHGYAPPPTNLVASRKVSQTTVWNLPTLYSLFLSPRSPNTNDQPTPILSAATVPKKLNLTAHASPLAATSLITMAI